MSATRLIAFWLHSKGHFLRMKSLPTKVVQCSMIESGNNGLPRKNTHLNFKLESVKRLKRGRLQERSKRRGCEFHQQFRAARDGFRHRHATTAEPQYNRVSRCVTIVHCHVVLHFVALLPNFQLTPVVPPFLSCSRVQRLLAPN